MTALSVVSAEVEWAPKAASGGATSKKAVFCLSVLLFLSGVASAQDASSTGSNADSGAKKISLTTRLAVTETATDNVRLASGSRQSELITEISPGLRISQNSGRVKGFLDYALNGRTYINGTSALGLQQALTAQGSAELVDGRAFVDLGAGISQQAISATGAQSTATALQNANLSETTSWRLAPYLRGRFAGGVDYETRYALTSSRSNGVAAAESIGKDFSLLLKGQPGAGRLGWSAGASLNSNSFAGGRTTESESIFANAKYAIFPQLIADVSLGQENTNVTTLGKQANWTNGIGVNWTPSQQTSLSFKRNNRPFGQTHTLSFSHRTAKTAWQYSDSQDVTSTPNQFSIGSLGNVYDLYFSQFASLEPDPTKRAALVDAYLQTNGINPKANVIGGFLTSAVSIQRRQNLSLALLGVRSTLTFLASRSASSRLDTISTAIDDLSNGSLVEQHGVSVNLGHRLTPDSAVNMMLSSQRTTSTGVAQDTAANQASVGISTRIGQRTTASVNARRTVFESSTVPYQENAISGTLSVQF